MGILLNHAFRLRHPQIHALNYAYRCRGVQIHFLQVTTVTQIRDLRSVSLQRYAKTFFASDDSHTLSRPPMRIAAEVREFIFWK